MSETADENLDWNVDLGPGGAAGLCGLFNLEKPVIAAVNGYCVGAAFEMVLACDMIVAAEHARFFLSEINMGLVSEAASIQRLLGRLPRAIALEMLSIRACARRRRHWPNMGSSTGSCRGPS